MNSPIILFGILGAISFINCQNFSLILNFETQLLGKLTKENFFNIMYYNEPTAYIKVGTHKQVIPFYINTNSIITYIASLNSKLKENIEKYNEQKSLKYKRKQSEPTYKTGYIYSYISEDEIFFNEQNNCMMDFHLVISKDSEDELQRCAMLGLGYKLTFYEDDDDYYDFEENEEKSKNDIGIESFLTQLKKNRIIKKEIYFLNYKNQNEGELIIGIYPHEYNNIYYPESQFIEMDNTHLEDIEVVWEEFGNIYYGENLIYNYLFSISFELNQGFIIGSPYYKEKVYNDFFKNKIDKGDCYEKMINMTFNIFSGYYCKNNADISSLKNLVINLDKVQFKIEFSYDELFYEFDRIQYFLVIFPYKSEVSNSFSFVLGKPFFQKYPMVFNNNGILERVGFYQGVFNEYIKNKKNNNIKKKEDNKTNNKIFIITLVLMGLIIISLLIFIFKYFKRPRKEKVNELIEFYDYSSANKSK